MTIERFTQRRQRFLEAIGPGVAVFPAAPVSIRNGDVAFPYRQSSDFYYLSGFEEPDSVLVLTNSHSEHRAVLFVRPRDPEREAWEGARAGETGAVEQYGMDAAFPMAQLDEKLPEYLSGVHRLHYRVGEDRAFDDRVFAALNRVRARARRGVVAPTELVDPAVTLHEMRMHKDERELACMRRAAEVTGEAHINAMRVAEPGRHEYEVEAELLSTFRRHGSPRPAYELIVGSGPNATVLHYSRNDRQMQDGDLLLIDAGCELDYYASDVTRTFPVNGGFSGEQRAVYDVVLAAQKAAIQAVRPNVTLEDVHRAALDVLVDGMIGLGLVEGQRDEVIEQGSYKKFFMHKTSHWLGMDVHDVGSYFREGKSRPLEPGFVLTVEPGLYIAPHLEVDARWRGIGVRIEDDVAVTREGREVLSAGVPKEPDEVERVVRGG